MLKEQHSNQVVKLHPDCIWLWSFLGLTDAVARDEVRGLDHLEGKVAHLYAITCS